MPTPEEKLRDVEDAQDTWEWSPTRSPARRRLDLAFMMEAVDSAAAAAPGWWSNHAGAALAQVRARLCAHHYSQPASMVMHLQECLERGKVDEAQQLWWVRRVLRECALRDLSVPPADWLRIWMPAAPTIPGTCSWSHACNTAACCEQKAPGQIAHAALRAFNLPDAAPPKHEQDGGGNKRGEPDEEPDEHAPLQNGSPGSTNKMRRTTRWPRL